MRNVLLVLAGMLIGALLSSRPVLDAASNLMFGSYNNAVKAVVVTSTGAVIVQFN